MLLAQAELFIYLSFFQRKRYFIQGLKMHCRLRIGNWIYMLQA